MERASDRHHAEEDDQAQEGQTGKLASGQTKPSGTTLTVCRSPLYSRMTSMPALPEFFLAPGATTLGLIKMRQHKRIVAYGVPK
jgi:hypothetical protein